MEKFMYPVLYMRITHGYMQGSHKGMYAIDDGCSDTLKDYMVAPYSGTVVRIYPQFENEVFFVSDDKVLFADGTVDYATTMFCHQDSPMAYGMAVGKHYNQGDKIYIEGGRYKGKNGQLATHVHLEFAQGKQNDWYKNSAGSYSLPNAKKPEDCCFIDDNYHILYNYGYNFKKVPKGEEKNYINLQPSIDKWRIYDLNVAPKKGNEKGFLNPKKFGGLTYYIYAYHDEGNTVEIQTANFGRGKIWITDTASTITIDNPLYEYGEY